MNYMRDNMDPQATEMPEVLTGIRSCPGCGSGLAGRSSPSGRPAARDMEELQKYRSASTCRGILAAC